MNVNPNMVMNGSGWDGIGMDSGMDSGMNIRQEMTSPGRDIVSRCLAFGYQYPLESIERTDLKLLGLTGNDPSDESNNDPTEYPHFDISNPLMFELSPLKDYDHNSNGSNDCAANFSSGREDKYTPQGSTYINVARTDSKWLWAPSSCEVFGRRYGDLKRQGKSLFCGEYVLSKQFR